MAKCNTCGNPDVHELRTCPHCGNDKCEDCDMGDDVECPACEELEDLEEDE